MGVPVSAWQILQSEARLRGAYPFQRTERVAALFFTAGLGSVPISALRGREVAW